MSSMFERQCILHDWYRIMLKKLSTKVFCYYQYHWKGTITGTRIQIFYTVTSPKPDTAFWAVPGGLHDTGIRTTQMLNLILFHIMISQQFWSRSRSNTNVYSSSIHFVGVNVHLADYSGISGTLHQLPDSWVVWQLIWGKGWNLNNTLEENLMINFLFQSK